MRGHPSRESHGHVGFVGKLVAEFAKTSESRRYDRTLGEFSYCVLFNLGGGGLENMTLPETSRRNPVGNQSHSVESGQQPKASLAWGHVSALHQWCILPAKRRQRRCRTMLLSPEISVAGVLVFSCSGDRGDASQWPDAISPAGVAGTWWASKGVPQEQERPVLSASQVGSAVVPNRKRPGPRSCVADRRERTDATQLAVPADEPNESVGMDRQESECLHSTEILAAHSLRGPRGAN